MARTSMSIAACNDDVPRASSSPRLLAECAARAIVDGLAATGPSSRLSWRSRSRPRSRRKTLYLRRHSRFLVTTAPRKVCWSCDGDIGRACGSSRSVLQSLLHSAALCCGRPRLSGPGRRREHAPSVGSVAPVCKNAQGSIVLSGGACTFTTIHWHGVAFLSRRCVLSDGRARNWCWRSAWVDFNPEGRSVLPGGAIWLETILSYLILPPATTVVRDG
ncbi:hypothetical protein EXIGLDRAFT_43012 [Exidia glandulosa HHB12029]|uniref:Uncharacterized protein n=1 Tax=Exidia glandulosa HHB12029 TaxID=1314781 RepID=A0A165IJG5_EXIGL|nr:hypothetical protein EXIGLDRAFT_43012 [Exidia glandulosa HHB12029]